MGIYWLTSKDNFEEQPLFLHIVKQLLNLMTFEKPGGFPKLLTSFCAIFYQFVDEIRESEQYDKLMTEFEEAEGPTLCLLISDNLSRSEQYEEHSRFEEACSKILIWDEQ